MKKLKNETKPKSKRSSSKVDTGEVMLRTVWVAETLICLLASVSAFVIAMVY